MIGNSEAVNAPEEKEKGLLSSKKPRRNKLNSWCLHPYTKSAEFLIIWKILIILLLPFGFEDRDAFVLVHLNSIRTNVSRLLF